MSSVMRSLREIWFEQIGGETRGERRRGQRKRGQRRRGVVRALIKGMAIIVISHSGEVWLLQTQVRNVETVHVKVRYVRE